MLRRLSSSATLGLRLFLPTFWVVFFGALTIAILVKGSPDTPLIGSMGFKIGLVIFFLTGVAFLYFTVFRLKRIEVDQEYIYITNYFKNYRYPLDDIAGLRQHNYVLFNICTVTLKQAGSFGRKIIFLPSKQKWQDFMASQPQLVSQWMTDA